VDKTGSGATATGMDGKIVRAANIVVDTAILAAILLLFALGGYSLWDTEQVYLAADSAQYEIYKPSEEDGGLSFAELVTVNPEVFAWLTVYGTHIDYPVAQGPDNMKYVNTNAEGEYSLSGALFLDSGSSRDFSDFSSILYGHHMEKEAMFGEIGLFADKSYFDARRYGNLYYGKRSHGLEFFAFLSADAYDSTVFRTGVEGRDEQEDYLNKLLAMSTNTRDIGVTVNDRIILLSTCSPGPTNGRDILVGRITDERYADPFLTYKDAPETFTADKLSGLLERFPGWLWIAIAATTILLLSVRMKKRKRQSEANEGNPPGPGNGDE
jgi:sortase B